MVQIKEKLGQSKNIILQSNEPHLKPPIAVSDVSHKVAIDFNMQLDNSRARLYYILSGFEVKLTFYLVSI